MKALAKLSMLGLIFLSSLSVTVASAGNSSKVTLCHNGHTIIVGQPASSKGHADDTIGPCSPLSFNFPPSLDGQLVPVTHTSNSTVNDLDKNTQDSQFNQGESDNVYVPITGGTYCFTAKHRIGETLKIRALYVSAVKPPECDSDNDQCSSGCTNKPQLTSLPDKFTFDANTGQFCWKPTQQEMGHDINVEFETANQDGELTDASVVSLAPYVAIAPATVTPTATVLSYPTVQNPTLVTVQSPAMPANTTTVATTATAAAAVATATPAQSSGSLIVAPVLVTPTLTLQIQGATGAATTAQPVNTNCTTVGGLTIGTNVNLSCLSEQLLPCILGATNCFCRICTLGSANCTSTPISAPPICGCVDASGASCTINSTTGCSCQNTATIQLNSVATVNTGTGGTNTCVIPATAAQSSLIVLFNINTQCPP